MPLRVALTSLARDMEVIQKRMPGRDRTLIHEGRAICPVGALLEETVPVLRERISSCTTMRSWGEVTTDNAGCLEHSVVGELVDDVESETVAL